MVCGEQKVSKICLLTLSVNWMKFKIFLIWKSPGTFHSIYLGNYQYCQLQSDIWLKNVSNRGWQADTLFFSQCEYLLYCSLFMAVIINCWLKCDLYHRQWDRWSKRKKVVQAQCPPVAQMPLPCTS